MTDLVIACAGSNSFPTFQLDGKRRDRYLGGMARPLRIEMPNGVYHVTSRGLERRAIALDEKDGRKWLELLDAVATRRRWRVFAWVLMGNHYHLFPETTWMSRLQISIIRSSEAIAGELAMSRTAVAGSRRMMGGARVGPLTLPRALEPAGGKSGAPVQECGCRAMSSGRPEARYGLKPALRTRQKHATG